MAIEEKVIIRTTSGGVFGDFTYCLKDTFSPKLTWWRMTKQELKLLQQVSE